MSEHKIDTIRSYYNYNPEIEWARLEGFHFEFEITKRMLKRHMKPGKVLDIGGGPGRYALYLAKLGYDVTLVDLSDQNVAFVRKKAKELGLNIKCYQADARNLSKLPLESYDNILLMGPLYHLDLEEDRSKCIVEAKRLLKPDGILFASFISINAGFNYYLDECPEELINETDMSFFEAFQHSKTWSGLAFTEATFIEPDDIEPSFDKLGFEKITIFGQEGITGTRLSFLQSQSDEVKAFYIDLSMKTCENSKLFPYTSHIMYVGKIK